MNVPKNVATLCILSGWISIINELKHEKQAAKPTNEWNNATVCGKSVTATFLPTETPTNKADPNNVNACVNNAGEKFIYNNVVSNPPEIPVIPNAFPNLADVWFDNPIIPPKQHKDDANQPIWYMCGICRKCALVFDAHKTPTDIPYK